MLVLPVEKRKLCFSFSSNCMVCNKEHVVEQVFTHNFHFRLRLGVKVGVQEE